MVNAPQPAPYRAVGAAEHGPRLVLASGSPRRRELLAALGATFMVIATDAEEEAAPAPPAVVAALPPATVALYDHPTLRAWRKAQAGAEAAPDAVVLGADTIVVVDGEVLNKPADAAEARAMLRKLAGRAHTVYTGLCVLTPEAEGGVGQDAPGARLELVATEVEFRPLDDAAIGAYVALGESLDKAGAYGVQGLGGRLAHAVRGSYTAVVGFPLVAAHRLLTSAGITGLADPSATYLRWLERQGKDPLPCPPTLP